MPLRVNVSRVNTSSRDIVSKTDDRIDKLADQNSNLVKIVNKQVIAPAKAVEKTCVTCGGAHAYYDCIATKSNQPSVCAATGSYNQEENLRRNLNDDMRSILGSFFQNQASTLGTLPSNTVPNPKGEMKAVTTRSGLAYEGPSIPTNSPLEKEEKLRRNLNNGMRSILGSFFQNQASALGTLPSNNVPNPKGMMKAVTTRSGLAYEGPSIPTNSPLEKVDTEESMDKEHSNYQGSTAHIRPLVVPILILEPDVPRTQRKPNIPYPSRLNDQKLHEKDTNQMEKFF
nr:reverse transcriptase domain-containing protein [Tanacetum cinerariifolium]